MEKVNVTLISGRTTQQGVGLEEGKTSENYVKNVRYVEVSSIDAESLDLREGNPVKISNENGSVIVEWRKSATLEQGMAFIPYGPWANQLFSYETEGTGMPKFKGIKAVIEEAPQENVLTLTQLVESLRRVGY